MNFKNTKSNGNFFIISGPSGSGKTTLTKALLDKLENIKFTVSYTTRKPRPHEQNGIDYFYISDGEFDQRVANEEFVEWAIVHGNKYGTPLEQINRSLESGEDLIFDVDVQGAESLKKKYPEGTFIFVITPSLGELKTRLIKRMTENDAQINIRLTEAKKEMEHTDLHDYIINNKCLDRSIDILISVIASVRCRDKDIEYYD